MTPTALLLIAHGSRRPEANADLDHLAGVLRARGEYAHVQPAYLELCEPGIVAGGELCVAAGARRVVLLPYFLSAGVHVVEDLTAARDELARRHPARRVRAGGTAGPAPAAGGGGCGAGTGGGSAAGLRGYCFRGTAVSGTPSHGGPGGSLARITTCRLGDAAGQAERHAAGVRNGTLREPDLPGALAAGLRVGDQVVEVNGPGGRVVGQLPTGRWPAAGCRGRTRPVGRAADDLVGAAGREQAERDARGRADKRNASLGITNSPTGGGQDSG